MRVMVQAPQPIQSEEESQLSLPLPLAEYLFFTACTRLSLFYPLLPFSHSPCLILLFLSFVHCPSLPLPHSQRLCPQNHPDSSLKSSARNHQITMEKERIQRGGEGHLRGKICFSLFRSYRSLSIAPFPTHILHFSLSPSRTRKAKRHKVSIARPLHSSSLSISVSPVPPIPLFLAVCPPLCCLSQVKC